jgi:dehydrogenase/reductase SDR family member 12
VSTPFARAVDAGLEATVALSFSRIGYAVRSRLEGWRPVSELDGAGRTVVVTGANSGLGYATSALLLSAGARVIALVRSDEKGEDTVRRLRDEVGPEARVTYDLADLADLGTVRAVAERLRAREPRIDAIVHNAGAMFDERAETVDGLERTYQLHVVGPHLLTASLLPQLRASGAGRVVTVTSGGMYTQKLEVEQLGSPDDYRPSVAYARAKRAQVHLTEEWQRRHGGTDLSFAAVHPGWALTPGVEASLPTFRKVVGPVLRDPTEGADTIAWLALAGDDGPAGRLWLDRTPRATHRVPWTRPDPQQVTVLWHQVCEDAGVAPDLADQLSSRS